MGILTLMIVAIVVLAVIGLGVGVFYSGMVQGAEKVGENPIVKDLTDGAENLADGAKDAIEGTR